MARRGDRCVALVQLSAFVSSAPSVTPSDEARATQILLRAQLHGGPDPTILTNPGKWTNQKSRRRPFRSHGGTGSSHSLRSHQCGAPKPLGRAATNKYATTRSSRAYPTPPRRGDRCLALVQISALASTNGKGKEWPNGTTRRPLRSPRPVLRVRFIRAL